MSPIDKVRLIVSVCFALSILISYRHLIPRLSPGGKFLATFMLAALSLEFVIVLIVLPALGSNQLRMWHLGYERNFPTALAASLLALVGLVALLTAWFSRKRSAWRLIYWVGIAVLFLLMAHEENFEQRHRQLGYEGWLYFYAMVGAVVLVATAAIAVRSPRHSRIWHACFVAGLGLGGVGAIGVEQLRFPEICGALGFLENGDCLLYMVEESFEFLGVWLVLVAILGQFSLVAPSPPLGLYPTIFALLGIVFGALILTSPRLDDMLLEIEYQFRGRRATVKYESEVSLRAYYIDYGERSVAVGLFVNWFDLDDLGYSVHLVDQATGKSVAGADESASRRQSLRDGNRTVFRQRIGVEIPPGTATNRAYWVVLTTWREENEYFKAQNVIASDLQLVDEKQVILGEIALPAEAADPAAELLAEFDIGFELGKIDMPESAHPGDKLEIPMAWSAAKDGADDYVQFLHFGHDRSGEWWVYDQQPLGARLPTRLWRSGLSDKEIWRIPLPVDLAPGQYQVFTGIYRRNDLERVPVRDSAGALYADARVPVGSLTIANS